MANEQAFDGTAVPDNERVGFCQDCGRQLTAATIRNVGSGVFCEPCLERRVAAGPGAIPGASSAGVYPGQQSPAGPNSWQQASAYPPPPPIPGTPGAPSYSGVPTPWLAGLLGFIPGVGAMYNGQFAKGVVHLIVFAVLVSLKDHVSEIFGLFVAGWIFYMVFEAYHTARARRDGLPLPDPFGLNNINERIGFGRNWPGSFTSGPTASQPNAAWQQPTPTPPSADWVGYVPPTNYATTPDAGAPPVPPPPPAPQVDPFATSATVSAIPPASAPYTNTAVPYAEVGAGVPLTPLPAARKFPVGAMVLIGLGVLFLLGNINHDLHLSWRWLGPLLIIGFAAYLLITRLRAADAADTLGRPFGSRVFIFRGPVMMFTVAVLWALQNFDIFTFGQTWPVFLLVLGVLLVVERTAARNNVGPMPVMDSDVNAAPSSWNAAKGGQ